MKSILILLVVIMAPMVCVCQLAGRELKEKGKEKIRFGIKAGIALADLKIEYGPTVLASDHSFKLGALGGIFLQLPLGNAASFQPELLLTGKGTKDKNGGFSHRTDLTYLELPLNVLYQPSGSNGSFFIGGGPAPAFFIGENIFYSGDQPFKKFDVGINLLTGFQTPMGFSFNINYTHGLINISQDKINNPVAKNRSFGLALGYVF